MIIFSPRVTARLAVFLVAVNLCAGAPSSLENDSSSNSRRKLSREFIAGYEPKSRVTDHNALDLDQEAIEQQLSLSNPEGYEAAFRIYTEGAHSKSVAEVELEGPLSEPVERGTLIMGFTSNGNQVAAQALEDTPSGAESLSVQYQISDSQKNYVWCRVGASVTPVTRGCLAANGTLTIDERIEIGYTYDPLVNNVNKRTIQGLSLTAKKTMWQCETSCPFDYYKAFVEYYGYFDYGNQIVMAAFDGRETEFNNFNSDFGIYGYGGREQIIKKATTYLIIWMTVVSAMENALEDCTSKCTLDNCNEDQALSWDQAVAFYTGMLEGDNGSGNGKLLYALADKRCANFKTCGENADESMGTSYVNLQILDYFKIGLGKLTNGDCEAALPYKDAIKELMLIPLIQGTLRYAWKTEYQAYSQKSEAEGAIFAMAVVPLVHRCDATAAKTIETNMVVGQQRTAKFAEVKAAFESTYECLGIKEPWLVGGLYDSATNSYYEGADPLGSPDVVSGSSKRSTGLAIDGGVVLALLSFSSIFSYLS